MRLSVLPLDTEVQECRNKYGLVLSHDEIFNKMYRATHGIVDFGNYVANEHKI
jgi:hypothetical protein